MRSVNKGPFVEPSLIRKVKKHIASKSKLAIKTKSRNSDIIADFVGLSLMYTMEKISFSQHYF